MLFFFFKKKFSLFLNVKMWYIFKYKYVFDILILFIIIWWIYKVYFFMNKMKYLFSLILYFEYMYNKINCDE